MASLRVERMPSMTLLPPTSSAGTLSLPWETDSALAPKSLPSGERIAPSPSMRLLSCYVIRSRALNSFHRRLPRRYAPTLNLSGEISRLSGGLSAGATSGNRPECPYRGGGVREGAGFGTILLECENDGVGLATGTISPPTTTTTTMSKTFSKEAFAKEINDIASSCTGEASSPLSRSVAEVLDGRDRLAPLRAQYVLPTMKDANVVAAAGECLCVAHFPVGTP